MFMWMQQCCKKVDTCVSKTDALVHSFWVIYLNFCSFCGIFPCLFYRPPIPPNSFPASGLYKRRSIFGKPCPHMAIGDGRHMCCCVHMPCFGSLGHGLTLQVTSYVDAKEYKALHVCIERMLMYVPYCHYH